MFETERPQLIDIGRGTVDARAIVAVDTIQPEDFTWREGIGLKPLPEYAKTEVALSIGMSVFTALDADTIVTRWRQALGGLPAPIGSES